MFKGEYVLYGMERSLFTRKLEAQLRYQRVPYRFELQTLENQQHWQARAGTHIIPVLQTPENWIMWDSTPIGDFLNSRFHEAAVIPETPVQRAACLILEDWIDEWQGRTAINSRWCYPDNAAEVGFLMAKAMVAGKLEHDALTDEEQAQVQAAATMVRDSFGLKACKGFGVTEDRNAFMRAEFDRFMGELAALFSQQDFLLGARPCMADFTVCAGLKAHFAVDPEPRKWVEEIAPGMLDYMERVWNAGPEKVGDWLPDDALSPLLQSLFDNMQSGFAPFARANTAAVAAGEKFFMADVGDGEQSFRARPYIEQSRQHVAQELRRCSAEDLAKVEAALAATGALELYS